VIIVPRPISWQALDAAYFLTEPGNDVLVVRITGNHFFGGKQFNAWFEGKKDAKRFWLAIVNGQISPDTWRLPVQPVEPFEWPIDQYDFAFTFVNVLTSGTGVQTYNVAPSFNSANNLAECIGGGGSGSSAVVVCVTQGGSGGGGGAYASAQVTLVKGSTTSYQIGQGGLGSTGNNNPGNQGSQSFFGATTFAASLVGAQFGLGGFNGFNSPTGGTGGQASTSIGTTKNNGGTGGGTSASSAFGSGGGGAGGPSGAGNVGTSNFVGSAQGGAGGSGDAGNGGAGGPINSNTNGGNGTELANGAAGSGGGGSGGFGSVGGAGGLYGGASGGAGGSTAFTTQVGGQGVVIVSWTPYTFAKSYILQ
jgi:hypothetical protein